MKAPLIDSSRFFQAPWARSAYRPVQGLVEGALGMARINQMYARVGGQGLGPAAFCAAGLKDLGVSWSVNPDGLASLKAVQGPCMVVANHPLGGREAMALQCLLAQARADHRIVSNFVVGEVSEVRPSLILVDPYETRASTEANIRPLIECWRWLRQGGLLGVFPAGEVSYWQPAERRIADKPWSEQALRLALKAKASIAPLHWSGRNSRFFQAVARMNPAWKGLLLVEQLAFGPSRAIRATLGEPIPFEALPYKEEPRRLAAWLREQVYQLDGTP